MDAFYAAIEQRDQPEFRGKPVIVGSPPTQRGVVCAASYEARQFGVRSAMPSVTAGRLCPAGIFVAPRMAYYRLESEKIMELVRRSLQSLGNVQPLIEQVSIDEAYIDVSGAISSGTLQQDREPSLMPAAVVAARELKQTILRERGLTASVGIASNKLLAKLASDFQKPNGLTFISEGDRIQFLRPLPVHVIHGVGQVTELVLRRAGVETIGDLQDFPGDLRKLVGSFGPTLHRFAFGEDDRPVEPFSETKSISSEETFERDTEDRMVLRDCLRTQAAGLENELKRKNLGAHTIHVKLRYSNFMTLTRQISVEEPVWEAKEIYRLSCFLLAREKLVHRPLRLLGISVSNFTEPVSKQLTLFSSAAPSNE